MNDNTQDVTDELRQVASELNLRILMFENWLNSCQFVSRTEINLSDDGDMKRKLRCEKNGNKWVVVVVSRFTDKAIVSHLTYLRDSAIRIKIEAVHLFPELFEKMKANRENVVFKIQEAIEAFDTFAESIGISPQEDNK